MNGFGLLIVAALVVLAWIGSKYTERERCRTSRRHRIRHGIGQ